MRCLCYSRNTVAAKLTPTRRRRRRLAHSIRTCHHRIRQVSCSRICGIRPSRLHETWLQCTFHCPYEGICKGYWVLSSQVGQYGTSRSENEQFWIRVSMFGSLSVSVPKLQKAVSAATTNWDGQAFPGDMLCFFHFTRVTRVLTRLPKYTKDNLVHVTRLNMYKPIKRSNQ